MEKCTRLEGKEREIPAGRLRYNRGEHPQHEQRANDGRDAHRIATHPGDRPIIIGGGDSEHASNKQPAFAPCNQVRRARPEKFLGEGVETGKVHLLV
jgi:hypothetical protein